MQFVAVMSLPPVRAGVPDVGIERSVVESLFVEEHPVIGVSVVLWGAVDGYA